MTLHLFPYSFGGRFVCVTNRLQIMERGIIVNSLPFIMDREPDGDFPMTQNLPPIFPIPSIHPIDDNNECATNVPYVYGEGGPFYSMFRS